MELLKTFATLALIAGALMTLLPEGAMRRTAALVIGLMMMLFWAEGLLNLLQWPSLPPTPDTPLAVTGASVGQAEEEARERLLPEVTDRP